MAAPSVVTKRPAEVSGVAGAVTLLVVYALGVTDATVIVALGVVVGAIPAAVTWAVTLLRKPPTPPTPPTA